MYELGSSNKPWWNDGDKIGAIIATAIMGGLALIILAICVGFAWKILGWFGVVGG